MTTSTCIAAANGHWLGILTGPGGVDPALLDGKPRPCPICGEGTDRFTFDDEEGRGTWICRQCPARPGKGAGAGDGMDLFLAVTKWDFKQAAEEIERHLGLPLQTASNDHRPAEVVTIEHNLRALRVPDVGEGDGTRVVLTRRQASPPPPAALPASPQGSIELLRLPEVPSDVVRIEIHGPGVKIDGVDYAIEATYWYSKTQKTDRLMPLAGTKKRFRPAHLSGDRWIPSQGSSPWPLYRQLEALAAAKANPGQWILETEGEKAAEIAREGGLVAISQPGHNHTIERSSARYADLTGPDVAGILYLADQDDQGVKRAQGALEAAAAVGLPLVVLPASEVWPSLPKGGSVDDAIGTPAQRVAAIEKEAGLIETNEWAKIWAEWQAAMGAATQVQQQEAGQLPPATTPSPTVAVSRNTRVGADEVLTLLPYHLGDLRLNVRSGEVHSGARGVISANEISRIYLELSKPFEVWPKEGTADGITLLASRNRFDPVKEYLEEITADPLLVEQWQRLDQHLLGIDDPIAAAFLPRYFISAVARAFDPGCYVRQVPVLIGSQERGKGELGRILFGVESWVEGVGALDRDALMKCHTAWGVELAEMDGITRRADQEHLKAFITETADTYRKPYDRSPERQLRRFVFWGTSNRPPLRDSTGSTRFVCIPIPDRPLPLEWAREHRDAIWAMALHQYRAGVTWLRISEEERQLVEERNNDFTELDPWADLVGQFLRRAQLEGALPVQANEVLKHLDVPTERQNNAIAKRVREIAERLGWEHRRGRAKGSKPTQGLWPKEETVHPVHPPCTPPCTPADPSEGEGDGAAVHPVHPYSQTLEKQEGGQGTGREQGGAVQKGLSSEGCTGCTAGQTDCSGVDLSKSGGVHGGVHGVHGVHGTSTPTSAAAPVPTDPTSAPSVPTSTAGVGTAETPWLDRRLATPFQPVPTFLLSRRSDKEEGFRTAPEPVQGVQAEVGTGWNTPEIHCAAADLPVPTGSAQKRGWVGTQSPAVGVMRKEPDHGFGPALDAYLGRDAPAQSIGEIRWRIPQ